MNTEHPPSPRLRRDKPNTEHRTPNTEHQTPNTKHRTPNIYPPKADRTRLRRASTERPDDMNNWLMKSEPSVYSIDDLERDGTTQWEGVRNYQARNIMRDDMKVGDLVLFYHSNSDPSGVAGVGRVSREGYPDHFAWNRKSKYFDERSTSENPVWMMVDVEFVEKFSGTVSLAQLKADPALNDMMVTRKGMRLSVQPVSNIHFNHVRDLGRRTVRPG